MDARRTAFLTNRILLILAVAAILAGLFFGDWWVTLRHAILL